MSVFTPSSFPRLEKCLGSAVLPNADEDFDSARKGRAGHDFLRALGLGVPRAKALEHAPEEFRKSVERIEAPEDIAKGWPELGLALDYATGKARALRENMTREEVRAARLPGETGMLLDWLAVRGEVAYVRDYKMGWQEDLGPAAEHLQLLTYTAAALLAFEKEEARGELWHWDGVRWRVDGVTLDYLGALDVLVRVRGLLAKAEAAREAYQRDWTLPRLSLGKWCAWCPAQRFCPARQGGVVDALSMAEGGASVRSLAPEDAGRAWVRLKQAKGAIEALLSDLEALAGQTPLPLPDGTVLRAQEREVRRINPDAAEEWLRRQYGDAAAGAAVETKVAMTQEGLTDALRVHVLPERLKAWEEKRLQGRKPTLAALKAEAMNGLASIGAVDVSVYPVTKPVRPELPSGEEGSE